MLGLQGQVWIKLHFSYQFMWKRIVCVILFGCLRMQTLGRSNCFRARAMQPCLASTGTERTQMQWRKTQATGGRRRHKCSLAVLDCFFGSFACCSEIFFLSCLYHPGFVSRSQTFCRSICRAQLCMMQVRDMMKTPGMTLLLSRLMTGPRNQAGVLSFVFKYLLFVKTWEKYDDIWNILLNTFASRELQRVRKEGGRRKRDWGLGEACR